MNHDIPPHLRIEIIARRAQMERSLHMGAAIGHMLLIATEGLRSLGGWLRRAMPRRDPRVESALHQSPRGL
jgi:hypothetical protein